MKIKTNSFLGLSLSLYENFLPSIKILNKTIDFLSHQFYSNFEKDILDISETFFSDLQKIGLTDMTIYLQKSTSLNRLLEKTLDYIHDLTNTNDVNIFSDSTLLTHYKRKIIFFGENAIDSSSHIIADSWTKFSQKEQRAFFLLHEIAHIIDYQSHQSFHNKEPIKELDLFHKIIFSIDENTFKSLSHHKDFFKISKNNISLPFVLRGEMFADIMANLLYLQQYPNRSEDFLNANIKMRDLESEFIKKNHAKFMVGGDGAFELCDHHTSIALKNLQEYYQNNPQCMNKKMTMNEMIDLSSELAAKSLIQHFKKNEKTDLLSSILSMVYSHQTIEINSLINQIDLKHHAMKNIKIMRMQSSHDFKKNHLSLK